jgi:2-polyprenyl-3-methyl-5-hydroxy-6-metoxy-1,4-benzoquinol methylase
MPQDQSILVEFNRAQKVSETDTFTSPRYRQFYRHFPAGTKSVLDVGCNTGRGGAILKECAASLELTGLDCVPERVTALDQNIYHHGLCGFTTDIPIGGASFDVVVGGEFIEHVPPVQVEATLAEFFRVLRLKGRLLLTTPNPHYLKNKIKGLSVLLDPSHVSQHFPDCLTQRLRLIGFSNVRIFGSGRVSELLGQHFPILSVYGSYLISADKW